MKYINIFLLFYFIINWSTAEVINKKDLNLFNQEDKIIDLDGESGLGTEEQININNG